MPDSATGGRHALRVAYVAVGRAQDVLEWSGLNAHIRASIARQGCEVTDVDQLGGRFPLTLRLRRRLHGSLLGTTYAIERNPGVVAGWGAVAAERLTRLGPFDALVSPGTLALALAETDTPIGIWADATFHALRTTNPEFANYSRASIDEGERIEKAALDRASIVCYASQWAADDAISHYGLPRQKVFVIPFGANSESPFSSAEQAALAVAAREWSAVRFLFLGVDWLNKGGDTAVAVVRRLNELGHPSILTIVGCTPPSEVQTLPFVECVGFLSKKNPAERDRLDRILRASHFLLLPTLADCFGLVFAEAAANALPSIGRAVGGVGSAVLDGHSGTLLPADADAEAYCEAVLPLLRDRERYTEMCAAAYRDHVDRLNWGVAGDRFVQELRKVVAGNGGSAVRRLAT